MAARDVRARNEVKQFKVLVDINVQTVQSLMKINLLDIQNYWFNFIDFVKLHLIVYVSSITVS